MLGVFKIRFKQVNSLLAERVIPINQNDEDQ